MVKFEGSMYDTDELELPDNARNDGVNALSRGLVTELDINGKKVEVIGPEYTKELQRLMLDMSNKMKVMDRNIQTLSFAVKQQARVISDLRAQLDGKIDRE